MDISDRDRVVDISDSVMDSSDSVMDSSDRFMDSSDRDMGSSDSSVLWAGRPKPDRLQSQQSSHNPATAVQPQSSHGSPARQHGDGEAGGWGEVEGGGEGEGGNDREGRVRKRNGGG